jgi:hypothetical protein
VHIDAFVPSWYEFKNSITAEIGLMHLEPPTNSYFHFFIIVELVTSQVSLPRTKEMEVQWGKVRTTGLQHLTD